jgi:hypothetical protein
VSSVHIGAAGPGYPASVSANDPERLADQREREAQELERRSRELADRVRGVREDWERKRADPGVPGAPPGEGLGS